MYGLFKNGSTLNGFFFCLDSPPFKSAAPLLLLSFLCTRCFRGHSFSIFCSLFWSGISVVLRILGCIIRIGEGLFYFTGAGGFYSKFDILPTTSIDAISILGSFDIEEIYPAWGEAYKICISFLELRTILIFENLIEGAAAGEIVLYLGEGVVAASPIGDIIYCVNFDSGCFRLVRQTNSSSS